MVTGFDGAITPREFAVTDLAAGLSSHHAAISEHPAIARVHEVEIH
jgi:hypothetical protein